MRLTGIEARRYGALEDACLAGLGDGLTVVLGPNESGKSTFTAMTRHVLYGYPYAHAKEPGYLPASGGRAARLVFSDEGGTWAIERVDGPKRGPSRVSAIAGVERPGLLDEIVGGVSEQTFRVVFGFGLDELAQIESAESADVVSRLYAAGSGLGVNPIDVRKRLEAAAADVYAARASKPEVNALAARIKALREMIRTLETEAASFATEQARLRELGEQIAPLRQQRDELETAQRVLARDLQSVEGVREQLSEAEQRRHALEREIDETRRSTDLIDVDERVVGAGPALMAVLDDASGFRARLEALTAAEGSAAELGRALDTMPGVPEGLVDSAQDRATVERWRDRLADARRDDDAAQRSAQQAEARAQQIVGVEEEQRAGSAPHKRPVLPAVGVSLVGLGAAVAGVVTSQWIAAVLGVLVLFAGVALLFRRPQGVTAPGGLSAEAARLKADALAQRQVADATARSLEALQDEWRNWLEERGMAAWGEEPASVRELLTAVQDRQRQGATRDAHLATAARERSAAEEWVVRLVDVVKSFDDSAGQIPTLTGALELSARARETLRRAQDAREERTQLLARLESLSADLQAALTKADEARAQITSVAENHGFDPADPLPELQAAEARVQEDLDSARIRYEQLSDEAAQLRGRLDDEGRDDRMARARQELEGLRARAVRAADRYVAYALSVRLLDRSLERFERERQPEVVRVAARIFSVMTDGRYTDVRVPLDGTGVSVISGDGLVRRSEELSRGTAEQLYLALRVGLIGSLGEMGKALPILMDDVVVNFDPQRRAGAVAAVRELAQMRQVLFFTCHPETAELLNGQVAGSTLLTLDRCAVR
jgi:uncharacterized protein YhaN